MKITISRSDLSSILGNVQGLTGRKTNMAITNCVLLKASKKELSICATDLETGFVGHYPAKIEEEGILAINSRKLLEIVKDFPEKDVLINEIENRWIEIGSQNVEYHLVGMSTEEFPELPVLENVDFLEVNSYEFKKAIEKIVMIPGPSDEKRSHIIGAVFEYMESDTGFCIQMASTDGKRLSIVELPTENKDQTIESNKYIIPKKGLTEVAKFLDFEGMVQIGFKSNHMIIKKEFETIIIRLLEGDFPQFKDLVKINEEFSVKMEKDSFSRMLKRMTILTTDNYRGVIFKFNTDKLVILVTNPDIGESKEEMAIDFKRNPIEVAFNPRYFIDTLNVLEQEQVVLQIIDDENPCLLYGENNVSFVSVIMPMRI